MRLSDFLTGLNSSDLLLTNRILLFRGSTQYSYPLLFFSFFIQRIKSMLDIKVRSLNLSNEQERDIKSKLETSFLGLNTFYWLHNIGDLKSKHRLQWVDYLKNYSGPNFISFFTDNKVRANVKADAIIIDVCDSVDRKYFLILANFFKKSISKSFEKTIDGIFKKNLNLSLDQACMLLNYAFLVGRSYKVFENKWLDKIVIPEKSLFILSQYFFEKKRKQFFELWKQMSADYAEQFWIVFWSEQLWRACNVVQLQKNRNFAEAKSMSFRLPFSFMQGTWSKFTESELQNAHDFIYLIDYSLKNGGGAFSLDLFYSLFLNDQLA